MTSCFFCQNLLSDYVEKLLPKARNTEIKKHLEECSKCRSAQNDLQAAQALLSRLPLKSLSHGFALKIMEASEGSQRVWTGRSKWVTVAAAILLPLILVSTLAVLFPNRIPVLSAFLGTSEENFARYYPLYHRAEEILDAQSAIIEMRDSFVGSMWEEGGLSPEDFEKVFQLKAV